MLGDGIGLRELTSCEHILQGHDMSNGHVSQHSLTHSRTRVMACTYHSLTSVPGTSFLGEVPLYLLDSSGL